MPTHLRRHPCLSSVGMISQLCLGNRQIVTRSWSMASIDLFGQNSIASLVFVGAVRYAMRGFRMDRKARGCNHFEVSQYQNHYSHVEC